MRVQIRWDRELTEREQNELREYGYTVLTYDAVDGVHTVKGTRVVSQELLLRLLLENTFHEELLSVKFW